MTPIARPPGFERLRTFLRRAAPAAVLLHTELGDRQLQCKSGAWRELADTIVSMKPCGVIEAFDPKGGLLRTFDAGLLGEVTQSETPFAPTSAMQSDVILIARLLSDAYRHSNETAFGQLVRLCEVAFRRLDVLDTNLTKLARKQMRDLERAAQGGEGDDEPEGEGDMAEAMLANLAKGVLQGQMEKAMRDGAGVEAPTPKPSNGTNGKAGKHGRA